MRRIRTVGAPAAVGPYSQGIITGDLLYTAGQIALTPAGKLVEGSIEDETHQVMANLKAILEASGCRFADVVQAKIYIVDKGLFHRVNAVYAQYFTEGEEPVRECVVAAPSVEGVRIEMSMIAELPAVPFLTCVGI